MAITECAGHEWKFVLKRGRYSVSGLFVNGFRVGTLSYSTTRDDPKPHVASIVICGDEWNEHFETEDAAKMAAMAKCKEIIYAMSGMVQCQL